MVALLSALVISLVSLIGITTLSLNEKTLKNILLYLVSLSAGALLGDAFIHLLPEVVGEIGFGITVSLSTLFGILTFFVIEKILHWHHYHYPHSDVNMHPLAVTNLVGDGFHNLIDGIIIATSYMVNFPTGAATTLAVMLHEIPQEIGDFGVLLHAGLSRGKAIFYNFLTALTAIFGVLLTYLISDQVTGLNNFLVPFAAGGFIYIAGSDLIPEIHKEARTKESFLQLVSLVFGMFLMYLLVFLE